MNVQHWLAEVPDNARGNHSAAAECRRNYVGPPVASNGSSFQMKEKKMERPAEEKIRMRAHEFWEQAGTPYGREDEFWHLAERDLLERDQSSNSESTIVPE
jgi:hypothetical protein